LNQSQIEQLLINGKYADAYQELKISKPSAWKDTYELKCLHALGRGQDAIKLAEELYTSLKEQITGYAITSSERNNQLRHISLVYAEHDKANKACTIMQVLCQKKPRVAALRREYAFTLIRNQQSDKAEEQLNIAIKLDPSNADSHARLGGLYCRTGRIDAGYSCYSRAATLEPDNLQYLQRLVYWSNYSERTTQQSNSRLAKLWANRRYPIQPNELPLLNGKPRNSNPERRLRIAFISADFCAHASNFFVIPLFRELDPEAFILFAYSDARKPDYTTDALRNLCEYWSDSAYLSDQQLAEQIREDQIDVLVDLGGHVNGNRLGVFARRAAPVQISWLGYPATTGLINMDYRITDREVEPVNLDQSYHSEELIRLRNGFMCYEAPETAPDIAKTKSKNTIRFGSFNSLEKISTLTLNAWAAAMHTVPNSSLYLKREQLGNERARDYFTERFVRRGIDPDRLRFEVSNATLEEHLNEYNNVDIAFDTSPYNGMTTALEALWMGVPVITLKGNTQASRTTSSILQRLNLSRLSCNNISEFCHCVEELSKNNSIRDDLRKNLRSTMRKSALMDIEQFSDEFTKAVRSLWRNWCKNGNDKATAQSQVITSTARATGS